MKKITYLLLLIFLTSNGDIFSLSDLEKYDLFQTAKNIIVIRSNGEKVIEKKSKYSNSMYHVEENWKGNKDANFTYYSGVLFIFKMGANNFDLSAIEIDKIDKNNTLFLVFDVKYGSECRLFYLNKKKMFKSLLPYIPVPHSGLFKQGGYGLNDLTCDIVFNSMKTHVDLLKLKKRERKKKLTSLRNLAPLKTESLGISYNLFSYKENSYSLEDFTKSYGYNYKIHFNITSLKKFNSDSTRYYLIPISIASLTTETRHIDSPYGVNHDRIETTYKNKFTFNLFVYDKKNKVFIKLDGEYYITKKTLRDLKKKMK